MKRWVACLLFCWAKLMLAQEDWEPRQALIDFQESLGLSEGDWQLRSSWGRGAAAPAQAAGAAWAQSTRLYWKGESASASLALQTDAFERGIDYVGFSIGIGDWHLGDVQAFIGQGLVWGQGQSSFGALSPLGLEMYPQMVQGYKGMRESFAFRGISRTWNRGSNSFGALVGGRKLDARWVDDGLGSIDRSGDHSSLLGLERKGNLRQHSTLLFASRAWIRDGNERLPHWKAGLAMGLSRFSMDTSVLPSLAGLSLWGAGPLGYGSLAFELGKEETAAWRGVLKYSQALNKWADWALQISAFPSSFDACTGLDASEDLASGLGGLALVTVGPAWRHLQLSSQWRLPDEEPTVAEWQNRLAWGGEHKKAAAGELSAWKVEFRTSSQTGNTSLQGRAQLRWALPSPLHNRFAQIKVQTAQFAQHSREALAIRETQNGQINTSIKWGRHSLGLVFYRGGSQQWVNLPSLPYQSSWKSVSGNGSCLSLCSRKKLGAKTEIQVQALWQSSPTAGAPLIRMFAQVQWKA